MQVERHKEGADKMGKVTGDKAGLMRLMQDRRGGESGCTATQEGNRAPETQVRRTKCRKTDRTWKVKHDMRREPRK